MFNCLIFIYHKQVSNQYMKHLFTYSNTLGNLGFLSLSLFLFLLAAFLESFVFFNMDLYLNLLLSCHPRTSLYHYPRNSFTSVLFWISWILCWPTCDLFSNFGGTHVLITPWQRMHERKIFWGLARLKTSLFPFFFILFFLHLIKALV